MPRENRNWEPILRDAAARGIGPVPLAREQNCDSAAVYWAEKHYGITLPRRRDGAAPSFAPPFVPAETEEWRYIEGWEGRYSASSYGRIRNNQTGRILSPHVNTRGYMQLALFRRKEDGGPVTCKVHRLVALTFLSNPEGLPHVNHRDCDKANNAAVNLEWASFDENFSHGRAAGRSNAIHNPNVRHKLTAEAVVSIRERYAAGERIGTIAADYPVCTKSHINKVALGRARRRG